MCSWTTVSYGGFGATTSGETPGKAHAGTSNGCVGVGPCATSSDGPAIRHNAVGQGRTVSYLPAMVLSLIANCRAMPRKEQGANGDDSPFAPHCHPARAKRLWDDRVIS